MEQPTTAFSAPGKVLFAGGYLVLDREFTGLVFGLDARIHVHIQTLEALPGLSLSEIIVRSPQFREAEWRYGYRETEDLGGIEVTQLKGQTTSAQSQNKFVETALTYALTYSASVQHAKIGPASITILADTDYYSHIGSSDGDISTAGEHFLDFNIPLSQAHKTGLGSSAALVTALTTAIVAHFAPHKVASFQAALDKSTLHNLAQAAHCAAQGKIGSGFDVAAAIYGSCVYRRFSPSILESLGEVGSQGFSTRLRSIVDDLDADHKWDTGIDKTSAARMPQSLRLVMCDVDCGSETVGMVQNLNKWRKENSAEAKILWNRIQHAIEILTKELHRLSSKHVRVFDDHKDLGTTIAKLRSLIREISMRSGVSIEPEVQTDLIDACCGLAGVVGGVVPGAGGYDAVALLIENKEDVVEALKQFLDTYQATSDGHGPSIGKVRLLGVRQDDQGLRAEDVKQYVPWLHTK